jgi:hypothetical protein
MAPTFIPLVDLLKQRAELNQKIQAEVDTYAVPSISPIQHILLLTILGLLEVTDQPPMASDLLKLIPIGSKPRAVYAHLNILRKKGLITLKHTGTSQALIYPTEGACRLLGASYTHVPTVLNPTTAKALIFIQTYVKKHRKFPTHQQINSHLGRAYESAGDILNTLLKNKYLDQKDGKWVLLNS